MQDFEVGVVRTNVEMLSGRVETLADDLEATERVSRAAAEYTAEIGDNWLSADASVQLARAVCDAGDPVECLRILDESEARPSPPDIELVVERPATRALALARLGRLEEAESFARQAIGRADGTQYLGYQADALLALAEVLRLAGRPAEAGSALEEAARLLDLKGNVVSAGKARALIEELAA
jgi:tetratricopeptide (TPR) repeat protein